MYDSRANSSAALMTIEELRVGPGPGVVNTKNRPVHVQTRSWADPSDPSDVMSEEITKNAKKDIDGHHIRHHIRHITVSEMAS